MNFLPTWPTGEDLTGLKPQKVISDAIVRHIIDYDSEHADGGIMPRVIGLEGKWGSGKSNVIKQLSVNESLADNYHLIEFDTWAYQEDEYKISLMEHVTNKLSQHQCENAKEYSELLRKALSQEEYKVSKFEPHVSGLLFWLIGTIAFTSLFGFIFSMFPDNEHYRWCKLLFVVVPWILLSLYAWLKKNDIDDLLVVFENAIRNGATKNSVYTREPSVSDLREWLSKVSDLCGKKLIVVIDNMDRLPNEKLKKLWSMIHIFANNEEMANAWIVIPYDEQKLKEVMGVDYKQYIRKTIPVTINVGEPIISDVRDVFDGLYKNAFGENTPYLENIRALFSVSNKGFSIRGIVHFINSMVFLKRQFEDFSLVSIALYVILEDEIKEHPYKVLLEDWFASKYATIVPVTEDNRGEVAAIVYHVPKGNAMQVVYENAIDHEVMGDGNMDVDDFKYREDFYKVLADYCSKVEFQIYEGYIDVLVKVESNLSNENYMSEIKICWQHVIQFYLGCDPFNVPWVSYERIQMLLAHCDDTNRDDVLRRYTFDLTCKRERTGGNIYKNAKRIDALVEQFKANRDAIFSSVSLNALEFREYLNTAKEQYARYPVTCESKEWVDYCCNTIEMSASDILCVGYMKNDMRFDLTSLMKKAEQLISESGNDPKNALNAYIIYRSLSKRPVDVKPARRIASSDLIRVFEHGDDIPVFIAMRMYHENFSMFDDALIPNVAEELMYLMHPLEIFLRCFRENIESYEKVTKYIIKNKLVCDYRLQSNALEFSRPLIEKGFVTIDELMSYIDACNKDADERNLSIGTMVVYK